MRSGETISVSPRPGAGSATGCRGGIHLGAARQVGQHVAHDLHALRLGVHDDVGLAGDAPVHVGAAELLGGDHLADGRLDDPRRRDRHATAAQLHDHVAERGVERRPAVGVAGDQRERGHPPPALPVERQRGQAGELVGRHDVGDPPAAALAEEDERHAGAHRLVVDTLDLARPGDRARAALDRDVVGDHRHPATVHHAEAADLAVAGRGVDVLDAHRADEHAHLVERAGVEQEVDALTGVRRPCGTQLLDLARSAHLGADALASSLGIGDRVVRRAAGAGSLDPSTGAIHPVPPFPTVDGRRRFADEMLHMTKYRCAHTMCKATSCPETIMTYALSGLDGKVALVTGAGRMRSIGRPIAVELARAGCDVVLTGTGRDPSTYPDDEKAAGWRDIESVADEVRALGRRGAAAGVRRGRRRCRRRARRRRSSSASAGSTSS